MENEEAMKFSIVIPSFNQAEYLGACLESVLSQTGVELEALVYDGGSTDGSRDIVEKYAPKLAYWQSQSDGGQAAALKAGFERATGDIFGWVNSDDMLLPGALSQAERYFEKHPDSPLVYGDGVWIDSPGHVIRPKREIDFDWNIFAYGYCYIPQPSAFFRRDAYAKAGGIDPAYKCSLDYDLWHRLVKLGPVGHIPVFMSAMRDHPGTKTNKLKGVFEKEHDIIRKKYVGCSKTLYNVRHVFERARRTVLRLLHGCYRQMIKEEIVTCGLKVNGS